MNDTINDLKLIGCLEDGQTICVHNKTNVIHKSWGTALFRYRHNEDGHRTVQFVFDTLNAAIENYAAIIEADADILSKAIKGLVILTKTYENYTPIKDKITIKDKIIHTYPSKGAFLYTSISPRHLYLK